MVEKLGKQIPPSKSARRGKEIQKPLSSISMDTQISIAPVSDLSSIVDYVNELISNRIKPVNDLSVKMEAYANKSIEDDDLREEFFDLLKDNPIYLIGLEIFPARYELKGVRGSEVRRDLYEAMAVVQDLIDRAVTQNKMDGLKKQFLYSLLGALEELSFYINPITDELQSLSSDQTHLQKTQMAIFSCASKLKPLETSLNMDKSPEKEFELVVRRLPHEIQKQLIKNLLVTNFKPEWVYEMSYEDRSLILNAIVKDPDLALTSFKDN